MKSTVLIVLRVTELADAAATMTTLVAQLTIRTTGKT
jgi:hypothetical protein